MKYDACHPRRIIPYHICHPDRLAPHPSACLISHSGREEFPAIPVLEIPPGFRLPSGTLLTDLGDYILYNGHHRRLSAICAGVDEVSVAILESDEDLLVNGGIEMLKPKPYSASISDHKKSVYNAVLTGTEDVLWAESWIYERSPISTHEVYSEKWTLFSTRVTQYHYFNHLLDGPVWKGKKILDYGGNIGTFLDGAGNAVNHDDYLCIDINKTVIAQGKRERSKANFLHYDRQSAQYNPDGVRHLPIPDCGTEFDIILAFSVFTHTHVQEMLDLVAQLRDMLATSGVLAFTFTDPRHERSRVGHMLERQGTLNSTQIDGMVKQAQQSNWCLLIDDMLYVEPGDELSQQVRQGTPLESYCSYFTDDFISSLFPRATVHSPIRPEWQYGCVMKN